MSESETLTAPVDTAGARDLELAGRIQEEVARFTGVPVSAINSKDRSQRAAEARFLSVHFVKSKTSLRLREIAVLHMKASHVPIVHALKTVRERMQVDRPYKERIDSLGKLLERVK